MSEAFTEILVTAERAAAGSEADRGALAWLLTGTDLAGLGGPQDRAYLAVLLDYLGMREQAMLALRPGSGEQGGHDAGMPNVAGMLATGHGEYELARELFVQALSAADDGIGLRVKVLANLATLSLLTGDVEAASAWLARARSADGQAGDPATDVLLSSSGFGIARARDDLPAMRQAVSRMNDATRARIAELGPDHPLALRAVASLAAAEFEVASTEDSTEGQERAIAVLEVTAHRLAADLGADHPQALACLEDLCVADFTLARVTRSPDRASRAASALESVSRRAATTLGERHPQARAAAANAASARLALKAARTSDTTATPGPAGQAAADLAAREANQPEADEADADPGNARVDGEDASEAAVLTVQWALHGMPGDRMGSRILASSVGDIRREHFAEAIERFSPGVLRQLPQVMVSYLPSVDPKGRMDYLALAIFDEALAVRDAGQPRSVRIRYFAIPYPEMAQRAVSYRAFYEAVRPIALPSADSPPLQARARAVTQPAPSTGGLASQVAALLLTGRPVCILGGQAISLEERLLFIDAVMSLLPYGIRAKMTVATWASSTAVHRFRLFFSDAPRAVDRTNSHVVLWSASHAQIPAEHTAALAYLNWLEDPASQARSVLAAMEGTYGFATTEVARLLEDLGVMDPAVVDPDIGVTPDPSRLYRKSASSAIDDDRPAPLAMPFYLVCGVSFSMRSEMEALGAGISELVSSIARKPIMNNIAKISIITFSDSASVIMPLADPSEVAISRLAAGHESNYGAAFRVLAQEISADYESLRRTGYHVYRPYVFFLTDGEPSDADWRKTFEETLTAGSMRQAGVPYDPVFVPFGFRDASAETLRRLASPPGRAAWYHARHSNAEEALSGLLEIMRNTISSSRRAANGLALPARAIENPNSM